MKLDKYIARQIVNAQIASDAGKHIYDLPMADRESYMAADLGYAVKDYFIGKAVEAILRKPDCGFRVAVDATPDQNGYDSVLVYFDFEADGKRQQVSFHSPLSRTTLWNQLNRARYHSRWDGIIGGSRSACHTLIRKLNLKA